MQVAFTRTIDVDNGKLLSRTLTRADAKVTKWFGVGTDLSFVCEIGSGRVNVHLRDKVSFYRHPRVPMHADHRVSVLSIHLRGGGLYGCRKRRNRIVEASHCTFVGE